MSNAITTTNTSALAALRTRGRSLPQAGSVLLCDTSGSMAYVDTQDGRRRIDHLAEILSALLSQVRLQGVWTFDSYVREVNALAPQLPDPSGSTALHLALDEMGRLAPKPAKLIVLCDGEVDQPDLAIEAAKRLGVPVDCYYVGPDNHRAPMDFLRKLARATGGDSGKFNIAKEQQKLTDQLVLRITHAKGA